MTPMRYIRDELTPCGARLLIIAALVRLPVGEVRTKSKITPQKELRPFLQESELAYPKQEYAYPKIVGAY
jgi:hypothetical protein